jgi:aspartate aminotransferase/aminotransferase
MSNSLKIAERMAKLDASGIRKVFDLAASLENPINLSIGQPDFDVPAEAKAEAAAAIERGQNKYTVTQGMAALREAIAAEAAEEFGWEADRPVLITSGVSGALMLTFLVAVDPGDEVLLMDPSFVIYQHLTNLVGAKPVWVDTYPDFLPRPEAIEAAITDRTRLLVLNSPCNPTGRVYPPELIGRIAEIATGHDLLVISDEIYNAFCYDVPFASIAAQHEAAVLMRGFSKTYAMTGWRLGWCTGPAEILDKMTMLQQYSFVCAPSMAQAAGLVAMEVDMSGYISAYRRKRDMVAEALGPAFGLVRPEGAFYAFVPCPQGVTGTELVTRAIEKNVLAIPGGVFSQDDTHFRIAYAIPDERLAEGLDILVSLAG